MRLTDLLALSHVPRWSVVDMRRPQSVAEHSFRVAVIAVELLERLGIPVSFSDVWYALIHDAAESRTGDVSGRFKELLDQRDRWSEIESQLCPWLDKELRRTESAAHVIVKCADIIETLTWLERNGRNPHAVAVMKRIEERLRQFCIANSIDLMVVLGLVKDTETDAGRDA